MFKHRGGESRDEYEHRFKLIANQTIRHDEHTSSDVDHCVRLVEKSVHCTTLHESKWAYTAVMKS